MMFTVSPLEQEILDEIQQRTGLSFQHIEGIDTRENSIAKQVLSILVKWVPKIGHGDLRHGVYRRFSTPHAHPFLSQILEWWQAEAARELPDISPSESIEARAAKLRQKSAAALIFPARPRVYSSWLKGYLILEFLQLPLVETMGVGEN